nr:hypothetical protein [Tanacetum cinerariifolium]
MDAERIKAPRKKKVEKDQTVKKKNGDELEQDNTEKQKLKEQQEAVELKKNLEIVPNDEDDVFVNVTPLSSKPPTIVDYKIYKEGKKEHFQIIRANGNHQMYLTFSTMLKNFDIEDLEVLWKIVKDRFKESQPKEALDIFLWHTLKVAWTSWLPFPSYVVDGVMEFPLLEEVPTASEESSHYQKKREAIAVKIALLLKSRRNCQSKSYDSYANKYKTAQELWAAILKTFGGNEATKKTKKNLLKQQYGNFKAEGSETLEQMFNRLQVIVSQLQFMDVEIEHDDLNQKFLTCLAPEWLMHTIVWRNRSDHDTMSLDDMYNHLKVYESKVQKKLEPNSQNMAFISLAKHSSGNEEVNTASVSTVSTNVSTASANIGVATISQDTACAYFASQSSCSQIKFEDINQIDEDDMEEMDIKWNMALLSMRADRFWKKTGKKISIQGTDVAGFDKSKVECFNFHKIGHFARGCRALRSQDRGRRDNYKQGSKVEEQAPKALMAIDGVGWDWSYMANDEENHALIADEETPTEFSLMAKTSAESEVFDNSLCSKASLAQVESRLAEHRSQELKYCKKIRV